MRKISNLFKQLGYVDGFLYSLNALLQYLSIKNVRAIKYYIYSQPVPNEALLPKSRGKDIHVAPVYPDDEITHMFPRPRDVIMNRFDQGALCFVAYKNNTFAGFLWLIKNKYIEDEVKCNYFPLPAKNTAWDFDVYISSEYRISFVFSKLWDFANGYMRSKGITSTMSRISAFNLSSKKSHARLGAQCIGQLTFFCIGPLQILFSSKAPFVFLTIGKKFIPNLKIQSRTYI